MSRFTPWRTRTRTPGLYSGDQRVEGGAHDVGVERLPVDRLPRRFEQHELRDAADGLLVACEGSPGPLAVDGDWARLEQLLDLARDVRVEAELRDRELRRREQAERDSVAVRELPVGAGRLER